MLCANHSRVVYVYKKPGSAGRLTVKGACAPGGGRRERREESSLNKQILLTSEQSDFSFQPTATTTGRAVVIATFGALRKDCRATPSIAFYSGPDGTLASQPRTGEAPFPHLPIGGYRSAATSATYPVTAVIASLAVKFQQDGPPIDGQADP
jgi:hypothetical protein